MPSISPCCWLMDFDTIKQSVRILLNDGTKHFVISSDTGAILIVLCLRMAIGVEFGLIRKHYQIRQQ